MEDVNDVEVKKFRRCKWWNGGFCREKKNCSFSHPLEDCENHLKGGCTTKGCKTKRHRKQCKYFNAESGCHRGESCEYLNQHEKVTEEKELEDKEEKNNYLQKLVQESKEKFEKLDIEIERKYQCFGEVLSILVN